MRRLPVFFVLDVSESMAGENLQKMEDGMALLMHSLRTDPHALESVYLSVIAFAGIAQTIVPLVDVVSFYPPKLPIGSGTSLGAALQELIKQIDSSIVTTTPEQKGDWKPFVYLFTDGKPTDNVDAAILTWQKNYAKKVNLIAVAFGKYADLAVLRRLTDTVLVFEDAQKDDFRKFVQWVTASVVIQSKSVGKSEKEEINLVKLDDNILKFDKKETQTFSVDLDCVVLVGRCQKNRNPYLIKYDRIKHVVEQQENVKANHFELTGCYPVTEDYFSWSTPGVSDVKVNTSELVGFPSCPYCGNSSAFAVCQCGRLMCLNYPYGAAMCPWCETRVDFVAGGSEAFEVHRGRG